MAKLSFLTFDEKLEASWGLHKIEKVVLEKEIAELKAENEKLRKALKPFADAKDLDEVTNGNLSAAAAAIRESGE